MFRKSGHSLRHGNNGNLRRPWTLFLTLLLCVSMLAQNGLALTATDMASVMANPAFNNPAGQEALNTLAANPRLLSEGPQSYPNPKFVGPPELRKRGAEILSKSKEEILPPNLFQEFIFKTRGRFLQVFGASLFNQPGLFGDMKTVSIPPHYAVGPGDELVIKIYGGTLDINQHMIVDREGMIALPKVGPVSVAGIQVDELQPYLKRQISKVLSNFNLFVTMGQLRGVEIYVVGQARRPGKYVVGSLSTVVSAIFETGGPNQNGSMRNIQLVRNGKVVGTVDLYDFLARGDSSGDKRLLSGDVINISVKGPQVAVMGAIPWPGVFELKAGEKSSTLKEITQFAGGIPVETSPLEASLERLDVSKPKPLEVQKISLNDSGLGTSLKDGDIVTFYPLKVAIGNGVTLRIADADPIRVPVTAESHVKDVIPSRETLMTSEFYTRHASMISPKLEAFVKGGYYLRHRMLPPSFEMPSQDLELASRMEQARADQGQRDRSSDPYAANEMGLGKDGSSAIGVAAGAGAGNVSGKDGLPITGMDSTGMSRDQGTGSAVTDKADTELSRQEEEFDRRAQSLQALARRSNARSRLRRDQMEVLNWDQAIIERINPETFSTQVIPFNLAKAIEGDPQSNLALQPGDTITIFGQRDTQIPLERRTQIVRLHGEVKSPGLYQVQMGETLPALIARAGGLTAGAYAFGINVSRQSVKMRQQENLDIVIRQLETRLANSNAMLASSTAEAGTVSTINQQNAMAMRVQIDHLKRMSPNGRISLELDPESPKLPDFVLEDGDEILVPSAPGYVLVAGAVYNENVLIYHADRKVSEYLKSSGVTPFAEKDDMFVLRADGSIVTSDSRNVEKVKLLPGDTIVVPEKIYKESGYAVFMRGLKDWTQVLFQLGLTATAIHVLTQ